MTFTEAIYRRRSVRTFDGTPVGEEEIKKITEYADAVKNPFDIPVTWCVLHNMSSPVITGTDTFIAGKVPRVPHAEEAFGYAFEKTVLYAETLGIGTTWIAGTMDRPAFERACGLRDGEAMPCVSPLGYPSDKMSLREIMMRKGVKADTRLAFEKLFFDGSFEKPLYAEKAGALRKALEAVRPAPSAVNKQPWRAVVTDGFVHFYEKRSKGYISADGWDLQLVDMGIALCHFETVAAESGLQTVFTIKDPGVDAPEGTFYTASYIIR